MTNKTDMPNRPQPDEEEENKENEGGCIKTVVNFFKDLKHKLFDA